MTVAQVIRTLIQVCEKRNISMDSTPVYLITSQLDEEELSNIVFGEEEKNELIDENLPNRIILSE